MIGIKLILLAWILRKEAHSFHPQLTGSDKGPTEAQKNIVGCANAILRNYPNACTTILDLQSDDVFKAGIVKQGREYMLYSGQYKVPRNPNKLFIDFKETCNFTIKIMAGESDKYEFSETAVGYFQNYADKNNMRHIAIQLQENIEDVTSIIASDTDRTIVIDANGTAWGKTPPIYRWKEKVKSFQFDCSDKAAVEYLFEYNFQNCSGCEIVYEEQFIPPFNMGDGTGVDLSILRELSKKLHLILQPFDSFEVIHGSTMGTMIATLFTYPYNIDRDVLLVPLAKEKLNKNALVCAFEKNLWFALLAAFLVITFAFYFPAKLSRDPRQRASFQVVLLQTFAILLGQGIAKPADKIQKILFAIWVMFSLVILNAYSGVYFSLLMSPSYEPQIDSFPSARYFEQIKTLLYPNEDHLFEEQLNVKIDSLPKSLKIIEGFYDESYIKRIAVEKDSSAFMPEIMANEFATKLANEGLDGFHKINYGIQFQSFMLVRGRLVPFMNKLIHELNANGLIKKWFEDFSAKRIVNNTVFEDTAKKPLKMEHFLLLFYFYFASIAITLIVFISEYA